jgi:hypothetical protein
MYREATPLIHTSLAQLREVGPSFNGNELTEHAILYTHFGVARMTKQQRDCHYKALPRFLHAEQDSFGVKLNESVPSRSHVGSQFDFV